MRSVMRPGYSRQPASKVQRSSFDRSHGHKTTFDAGYLVPVLVDEAMPGDVFRLRISAFARLATAVHPIMDNMKMTFHCWSIPMRILWSNFRRFYGERVNPTDSIDYTIPTVALTGTGDPPLFDYMGVPPTVGLSVNALFARAYNKTYNEHYRAAYLQDAIPENVGDGPDLRGDYQLRRRGKRPDYFTTALAEPQAGDSVTLPLGTAARVSVPGGAGNISTWNEFTQSYTLLNSSGANLVAGSAGTEQQSMVADLTNAAAASINSLRQSFALQQHLEMDNRGGSRFPEIIWSQFGTEFQDVRYRPEFLGGGVVPVNINAVANQTKQDTGTSKLGDLAAIGTVSAGGIGFTKAFDEPCIVMVLACVDADLTYQYGLERMWSRRTRYDFFWPSFAFIGDQAILRKEIFAAGTSADDEVFGYAPRHEDFRTKNSRISGKFRSVAQDTLDVWHLAEKQGSAPVLGPTWIESNPPVDRVIAVQNQPHFIVDMFFNYQCARPIPVSGIPGMTRL